MKSLLSLLLFSTPVLSAELCMDWETEAWYVENKDETILYYLPPVESSKGLCRVTVYESLGGCEASKKHHVAGITSQTCQDLEKNNFVSVQPIEDRALSELLNWLNHSFSKEVTVSNTNHKILVGKLLGVSVGESLNNNQKHVYFARYAVTNSPDIILELEQNSDGFNILYSNFFHVD